MGNEGSKTERAGYSEGGGFNGRRPIKSFQNGQADPLTFKDLLCGKCCVKNQFGVGEQEMFMAGTINVEQMTAGAADGPRKQQCPCLCFNCADMHKV